jgi:hypothetical protein
MVDLLAVELYRGTNGSRADRHMPNSGVCPELRISSFLPRLAFHRVGGILEITSRSSPEGRGRVLGVGGSAMHGEVLRPGENRAVTDLL